MCLCSFDISHSVLANNFSWPSLYSFKCLVGVRNCCCFGLQSPLRQCLWYLAINTVILTWLDIFEKASSKVPVHILTIWGNGAPSALCHKVVLSGNPFILWSCFYSTDQACLLQENVVYRYQMFPPVPHPVCSLCPPGCERFWHPEVRMWMVTQFKVQV